MHTPPDTPAGLSPLARSGRQHTWLIWATVVGTIAALAGVVLLAITPDPEVFDYVLKAGLAAVYGACASWLLFFPNADPIRIAASISVFTTLAFGARFASAVVLATDAAGLEIMLLPYAGWWALVILLNFVLLPVRQAVRINFAYWVVLVVATVAAGLRHTQAFLESFQLICMATMILTGLPLFGLLLYGLIATLDAGWKAADRLGDSGEAAPARLFDTLSEEQLLETAARGSASGACRWLAVATSERPLDGDWVDVLRACLAPKGEPAALLGNNQLGWISGQSEIELRNRLDRLEPRLRRLQLSLSIGVAENHFGETPRTWLERARFAAFAAQDDPVHRILFEP